MRYRRHFYPMPLYTTTIILFLAANLNILRILNMTDTTLQSTQLLPESSGMQQQKQQQQQLLQKSTTAENHTKFHNSSKKTGYDTEAYVISFSENAFNNFVKRNTKSEIGNDAMWVFGVNGMDQTILNLWAEMTNSKPLQATQFNSNDKDYDSRHHIGCYLAHWNLLHMLGHRKPQHRPDLWFVLEDDASCVPNLRTKVLEIVSKLPPDWDMLYIGGKPFTTFTEVHKFRTSTKDTFREDACKGAFGHGDSPLAPDGSRNLTINQSFWRTKFITNTEAYVVNPKRVDNILEALKPSTSYVNPVDIQLADAMFDNRLNAYMPTMRLCAQRKRKPLEEPFPWEGYFWLQIENITNVTEAHPSFQIDKYYWDKIFFEECAGKY